MFVFGRNLLQVERSDRSPRPKYPLFSPLWTRLSESSRQLLSPWVYVRCHSATACCKETS